MNVKSPTNLSQSRFLFIGSLLSLAGLAIIIWIVRIQTSPSAEAIVKRAEQENTYIRRTVYPARGIIYDRFGHVLAGNVEMYQVGVELGKMTDPKTIAMTTASILGVDYGDTMNTIDLDWEPDAPGFAVISNNVSADKIAELAAVRDQMNEQIANAPKNKRADLPTLDGLTWTPLLFRSYPEKEIGSTVLGYYQFYDITQGRGVYGVEEAYNHLLAGTPVDVVEPRNPRDIIKPVDVAPGDSIVLTIDREIQAMAEEVIDNAVKTTGSDSGTLLIMDPRTGEVLGMASTPRMDPNRYWMLTEVFPAPTPFNRSVEALYEPGSVFKVLTMAAGLDSGTVTPETTMVDTGSYPIGGIFLHNWDYTVWGQQDMTGCLEHSINVCMAWIADQMGPTRFYDYIKKFGIGHKTGIDLANEAYWPLKTQADGTVDSPWYPVNLGTNSFGQGVSVTPIQMVTAISAVANDGKMMAPHVLKAVIENGKERVNPPQLIGQPITAETAHTLNEMLANSVASESYENAQVEGYRIAGKTGTAEIPTPNGYSSAETNASFVGWGPVDDPRFIVYVWLERPSTDIWGSIVAAPVFKETVEKLVVLMDIPPDAVRQQLANNP